MHARSQRFELELRALPPGVEVIVLPRPRDTRDLFDFTGARELMDEAYELVSQELDRREAQPATVRKFAKLRRGA
jgi:hypothetical protein